MKIMHFILLVSTIYTIQMFSQQPNFYPMSIGNEYQMYNGYRYWFIQIQRDTLYPNGKRYFHIPGEFWDCRIDSAGNLLSISKPFFIGITSDPEEYMLFKADADSGEVWPIAWNYNPVIDTGYGVCLLSDSIYLFGGMRKIKGVRIYDASYYYYYFVLVEGIGLYFDKYDDGSYAILNYARINGTVYGTFVSVEDEYPDIPHEFSISQNYPNPFNGMTKIDVFIPDQSSDKRINLSVFNILGSKLYEKEYDVTGSSSISLDTGVMGISSGVYFYSVAYNLKTVKKKFILIK
jgi:hypothetical protein